MQDILLDTRPGTHQVKDGIAIKGLINRQQNDLTIVTCYMVSIVNRAGLNRVQIGIGKQAPNRENIDMQQETFEIQLYTSYWLL